MKQYFDSPVNIAEQFETVSLMEYAQLSLCSGGWSDARDAWAARVSILSRLPHTTAALRLGLINYWVR
jgi:hypothetical protein